MRSRSAVYVSLLAVIAVATVVTARLSSQAAERRALEHVQQELLRSAQLVTTLMPQAQGGDPAFSWDGLADQLGARMQSRVTLIADDGRVVGDSAISAAELSRLDNHADRPEVTVARQGHPGFSVRQSTSVTERLAYVAVPLSAPPGAEPQPDAPRVLRLSRPANGVTDGAEQLAWLLLLGGSFAFAAGAAAVWAMDRHHALRVQSLRAALRTGKDGAVKAVFQDDGDEAKLARAIEEALLARQTSIAELRDETLRQRRILESMQEGVLVLDERANIDFVNRALREMCLLDTGVVGKPLLEALRIADLSALIERTRRDEQPQSAEIETQGLKPRRMLVQTSPLEDSGVVAVFVDVTEVRRLESLRRDFVANVSHELRTPVTAIRSATETLRDSALKDPTAALRFLDIVDRNAQRLGELVEDLLDLSRIESKAYNFSLEPLSVHSVATYCASLFRERVDKKRLQLEVRLGAQQGNVIADRRALEQVLTNLIDNAVKYCPQGAVIALDAKLDDRNVEVIVSDTGPGIDAKHLPRLFERFYRVDAGRARDTGGTGLGLSIAKHLVEAMGGAIAVSSRVGEGTVFTVRLPRA